MGYAATAGIRCHSMLCSTGERHSFPILTSAVVESQNNGQRKRYKNRYHGFSDGSPKPSSTYSKLYYALIGGLLFATVLTPM